MARRKRTGRSEKFFHGYDYTITTDLEHREEVLQVLDKISQRSGFVDVENLETHGEDVKICAWSARADLERLFWNSGGRKLPATFHQVEHVFGHKAAERAEVEHQRRELAKAVR